MFNQCCIFAFWFSKRTDQSSIYPAIWLSGGWRALPHILGEICPSHLSLRKSQLHAVQLDNFLYKLTSVATASWHFFIHLDIFGVVAAYFLQTESHSDLFCVVRWVFHFNADPFGFLPSGWIHFNAKLACDELGSIKLLEHIPIHESKILVESYRVTAA